MIDVQLGVLGKVADLAELPCDGGILLISALRLTEHLRQDPIAGRTLYNMIDYVASAQGNE